MMKMIKIFALPFLAVLMASAANADIVAESLLSERMSEMVPATRTVNGNALSENVTLDGRNINVTGYAKATTAGAVVATDTVNQAIGKLEKTLDNAQNMIPSGSENSATLASIWVE